MPLLGAHMSIAGGYYKAVDAAAQLKMDCVQIFTKNNNQWRAKPISEEDVALFRESIERTGIEAPCAHTSYLINLASPNDELWRKSLDAFVVEIERAEALGLVGLVIHPGSFVESNEKAGIARIAKALKTALRKTKGCRVEIWLETTAGQGTNLGWRFEQLRDMLDRTDRPARIGICVDTCHIFAAGYALKSAKQYQNTMDEFDAVIGTSLIRAFHLNDSKREQGSRVDRHENIGEGELGREPFRHVLNDPRFAGIPMYLETPKGDRDGKELDAINLGKLRRMIKRKPTSKKPGKKRTRKK